MSLDEDTQRFAERWKEVSEDPRIYRDHHITKGEFEYFRSLTSFNKNPAEDNYDPLFEISPKLYFVVRSILYRQRLSFELGGYDNVLRCASEAYNPPPGTLRFPSRVRNPQTHGFANAPDDGGRLAYSESVFAEYRARARARNNEAA